MRFNKRASLEIGVNTIVILVIAMMLLGLGIGFVRSLFSKANQLPGLIDTSQWQNPPTASSPVVLTPSQIEVKGGDSTNVVVGIYNKESSAQSFGVKISSCTGEAVPSLKTQPANIPSGESVGIPIIITAVNTSATGQPKLPPDKYICTMQAAVGTNPLYETQFIMTVTS